MIIQEGIEHDFVIMLNRHELEHLKAAVELARDRLSVDTREWSGEEWEFYQLCEDFLQLTKGDLNHASDQD